jgi:hypothetical protein
MQVVLNRSADLILQPHAVVVSKAMKLILAAGSSGKKKREEAMGHAPGRSSDILFGPPRSDIRTPQSFSP